MSFSDTFHTKRFLLIFSVSFFACYLILNTGLTSNGPIDLPLEEIALEKIASGSDKARQGNGNGYHGYTRYYERIFERIRRDPVRLVEIGVEDGNSIRMWLNYFRKANHVYGVGYGNFQTSPFEDCSTNDFTKTDVPTPCTLFRGDQSDLNFLEHFVSETGGGFDIIIDDGSHVPNHQLFTFENLWSEVKPGGMYIIEDIETNWWASSSVIYGYPLVNQTNVVEKLKGVVDTVNRLFTENHSKLTDEKPQIYGNIASIEFGENIIIMYKSLVGDEQHLSRPYRFQSFIK